VTISRLKRVLYGFSIPFILCGCGGRIVAPQHFKPQAKIYHTILNDRTNQVKSMSGELSVEVWESGKRVAIKQLFASIPPNRLRMDTLTPFGQPLSTIIYNDQLLSVHDRDANRFMMGEANRHHFERLTKLNLHPSDMSTLLSGQLPRLRKEGGRVRWDERLGRAILELTHNDKRQVITFNEADKTPRMTELYEANVLVVRVLLADYTKTEPKVPRRLKIELPASDIKLSTTLTDFTLNPEIPSIAFEIEAPPGLKPQSL
jgi:outer membrane lipoprotein-sorting protein